MDIITQAVLRELATVREFPSVSIYLPTSRGGTDAQQNIVRLRNAVRQSERLLMEKNCSNSLAAQVMGGAQRLIDDPTFWNNPADGLAVFLTGERSWNFRVPISFTESVHVGESFHLPPLALATSAATRVVVLALSENRVKAFVVDDQGIRVLTVPSLPPSLREALHYDEPAGQIHVLSTARFRNHKEGAVFHGQGASTSHVASDLLIYCRAVDKAMAPVLAQHGLPLIVAATERLAAAFAEVSSYPHLLAEHIGGSPDHWTDHELFERARTVIHAYVDERHARDVTRLTDLIGAGLAASQPNAVLPAACRGQVHELLIAAGAHLHGHFNRDSGELQLTREAADAEDLIDIAVRETLIHDGTVRAVKADTMATSSMIAGFRYVGS